MIGVGFGTIYVFVPALTSAVFGKAAHILPIPWIDLTTRTETFLPAAPTGISTNLGLVIVGMVLPFSVVIGRFAAPRPDAVEHPAVQIARLPAARREPGRQEPGVLAGPACDLQHQALGRQNAREHVQYRLTIAPRCRRVYAISHRRSDRTLPPIRRV